MATDNYADKAEKLFLEGYSCSQAILMAWARECDLDIITAKKISAPFGGGMGRLRKTCGSLTGAFMVIGLKFGNIEPKDMKTKLNAYRLTRLLAERFGKIHGSTECGELLATQVTDSEVKKRLHHQKICRQLVRDAALLLAEIIKKNCNCSQGTESSRDHPVLHSTSMLRQSDHENLR